MYLLIEPATYAKLGSRRESFESQFQERLVPIVSQFTNDRYGVTIAPKVEPKPEWRHTKDDVSRVTRQNVIDGLRLDNVVWSGRLGDVEFLQRLLQGSSESFLRFLCEMVHPVVRPDRNEALRLVQQFNDQLRQEGWNLVEIEKIAGRPRFG